MNATDTVVLHDLTFRPYRTAAALEACVAGLAARLSADYQGRVPLFVVVLNGAFMFAAELLKRVTVPCEVNFVRVSSYVGTTSSGKVEQLLGLTEAPEGRHVVIVEDIVDSGLTIDALLGYLRARGPASLEVATLLLKPASLQKEVRLRYVGMEIDDRFVVGYGLDYRGLGRNLPRLYQLANEE